MGAELFVAGSVETAVRVLGGSVGATPQPCGAGAWRVDVLVAPDPMQVARAEQVLARRGYYPRLAGSPGRVLVEVRPAAGGCVLRHEALVRVGAAQLALTREQAARLDEHLGELAASIEAADWMPEAIPA